MAVRIEEEPLPNEEKPDEVEFVHPLDEEVLSLENGYIPSWTTVSKELGLSELPRGQRKLFRSFYRAHRFYARGKSTKGLKLIRKLERLKHFQEFEEKFSNQLDELVTIVSRGTRRRL